MLFQANFPAKNFSAELRLFRLIAAAWRLMILNSVLTSARAKPRMARMKLILISISFVRVERARAQLWRALLSDRKIARGICETICVFPAPPPPPLHKDSCVYLAIWRGDVVNQRSHRTAQRSKRKPGQTKWNGTRKYLYGGGRRCAQKYKQECAMLMLWWIMWTFNCVVDCSGGDAVHMLQLWLDSHRDCFGHKWMWLQEESCVLETWDLAYWFVSHRIVLELHASIDDRRQKI